MAERSFMLGITVNARPAHATNPWRTSLLSFFPARNTYEINTCGKPILSASNSSSGVELRINKSHYLSRSFVFVV